MKRIWYCQISIIAIYWHVALIVDDKPLKVLSGVPFLSTVADLLRKTVVFRDLPKNIIQKHNVHLYLYNS